MTKPRDPRGLMSRLPDDEAYWDALADRIVSDASTRLREYRQAGPSWWHRLSRMSTPLTLAAAASVVAAFLWLPEAPDAGPTDTGVPAVFGLAPTGPLADWLVAAPAPPTMATLIAIPTPETQR